MALALPFFAVTLFVSAFLLFLVQPMIGKMILPRLGGTPQVWNTCMVFFQMALLAGYAYTHAVSTRLKLQSQLFLHTALLIVVLAFLFSGYILSQPAAGPPASGESSSRETAAEVTQTYSPFYSYIRENFRPIGGGNPIISTLLLLTIVIGLPFFVVATSAPLLQRWFAYTGHPAAKDPYFLYGASNLGSLLSLIAYPLVIEPNLWLATQAWVWAIGYGLLVVFVLGCAVMVWKSPASVSIPEREIPRPEPDPLPELARPQTHVKAGSPPKKGQHGFKKGARHHGKRHEPASTGGSVVRGPVARQPHDARLQPVNWLRRLRWIGLAAVPSSLMLGVTTFITTDLSPIPLFWLIPLIIYLLSFVVVFARWPVVWVDLPHTVILWLQPLAIFALILAMYIGGSGGLFDLALFVHVGAFAVITFACHGELAKDRPSTSHLTEFYLLMSVGGMLGGMFNALVAPEMFDYVIEYALAVFFSTLLRPQMFDTDWLDEMFGGALASSRSIDKSGSAKSSYALDVGVAVVMLVFTLMMTFVANAAFRPAQTGQTGLFHLVATGIPLFLAIIFMGRPLRYGLSIGAILLIVGVFEWNSDTSTILADRSYFGVLRVKKQAQEGIDYNTLIHGHINHGMNFYQPSDPSKRGNPEYDFSRLATTYYHRKGPAGIVMEKYNWFPDTTSNNTFWADARMPASLVGMGANPFNFGNLPLEQLVDLWSEPPYATIGLGTGTMASYARPFQHMHYYEIDNHILRLSAPQAGKEAKTYFTYLREAKNRGAEIWVFMGDARLRMAQPYEWDWEQTADDHDNAYGIKVVGGKVGGGPENFYHMMVVDAFSSDAIPIHLLTKQAVQMYFKKLAEEGILCVHTSNRYVELVPVVADIANSLGLAYMRGHDQAPQDDKGHFTSEWVMVARKAEYMRHLEAPDNYQDLLRAAAQRGKRVAPGEAYWEIPPARGRHVWTDDYSNLIAVLR